MKQIFLFILLLVLFHSNVHGQRPPFKRSETSPIINHPDTSSNKVQAVTDSLNKIQLQNQGQYHLRIYDSIQRTLKLQIDSLLSREVMESTLYVVHDTLTFTSDPRDLCHFYKCLAVKMFYDSVNQLKKMQISGCLNYSEEWECALVYFSDNLPIKAILQGEKGYEKTVYFGETDGKLLSKQIDEGSSINQMPREYYRVLYYTNVMLDATSSKPLKPVYPDRTLPCYF